MSDQSLSEFKPEPPSPTSSQSSLLQRRQLRKAPINVLQLPQAQSKLDCRSFQSWLAEDFQVLEVLGQGTTSIVQRAVRRSDGLEVALKIMMSSDPETLDTWRQEFEVLQHFQHPYIIRAFEFLCYQDRAVLVLEYFDGVSLDSFIKRGSSRHLSEGFACKLTKQLLQVVEHMHRHHVLHRDIKPENVLISNDGCGVRLIDFNVACSLKARESLTPTGTRLYAAPEVIQGQSPSAGADVWGIGLCCYMMLSGRLPQKRERCMDSREYPLHEAARRPLTFSSSGWKSVSEPCIATLKASLAIDPKQRLKPKELLGMAWFLEGGHGTVLDSALKKCPLLPGLEPTKHRRTSKNGASISSVSTGVPSSGPSSAATLSEKPEQWVANSRSLPSTSTCTKTLGEPGQYVEIVHPKPGATKHLDLCCRVGEKAAILMVDKGERIYKLRFSDNSVCCVPMDLTVASSD